MRARARVCPSPLRRTWKRRSARGRPSLSAIQVAACTTSPLSAARRYSISMRRHAATQRDTLLERHAERPRVRPGGAVEPGEVDGVVDVLVGVDVLGLNGDLDDVRRGMIEVHGPCVARAYPRRSRSTAR